MSLSYCTLIYKGEELPLAMEHISNAGYDGIELNSKDWEWVLSKYSLKEFRKLITKNNLKVSGVFGGVINSEHDLGEFFRATDVGCSLGCKYVTFVATYKQNKNINEFYAACKKACKYLKDKNMTAVLHNHAGTVVETSDMTLQVCKAINEENFGVCFDSVHYALFEDDLSKCILKIKDYIKYVHLKDMKKTRTEIYKKVPVEKWRWGELNHLWEEYTGLGEGVLDNKSVVEALLEIGYKGWWMVEIERQEYNRELHAINNINVLKRYLAID